MKLNYFFLVQDVIWEIGVIAVMFTWIELISAINKIPRFASFKPLSPTIFFRYVVSIFPILLFLLTFAFAFHFLLYDKTGFTTFPHSIIKTLTWLLGDLGYNDTFLDDESPVIYPFLANLIFVVFITFIAGLVFNLIVGYSTDRMLELQKEDAFHNAITHLNLHLLIDECCPTWRRDHARSHVEHPKERLPSFYVSSRMLEPDAVAEEKNSECEEIRKEVERLTNLIEKHIAINVK